MKRIGAAAFVILLIWIGTAFYLEKKSTEKEREYFRKQQLLRHYETLKGKWSEKSQRRAMKKFVTMLRLYNIKPIIKKKGGRKKFIFVLGKREADIVLGKLLNSDLAIESFDIRKKDDRHLEVSVGVRL